MSPAEHVPVAVNRTTRESRLFDSTGSYVLRNAVAIFRAYTLYRPLRVFTVLALVLAVCAAAAWTPFMLDWILNGDTSGLPVGMARYDLRPAKTLLGYEPRDRWPEGLDLDAPAGAGP